MRIKTGNQILTLCFLISGGLLAGIVNGIFGTGGGIITIFLLSHVPAIKNSFDKKDIFAMTLFSCFITSVFSALTYLGEGKISLSQSAPYILPSFVGGILGSLLLDKIKAKIVSKIFSILVIYAGIMLILR